MRNLTLAVTLFAGPLLATLALGAAPAIAAPTIIGASCQPVFPGVVAVATNAKVQAGSTVTITTKGPGAPPSPATSTLPTPFVGLVRVDYQLSSPNANGCLASISAPAGAAVSSSGGDKSGHGGSAKSAPHCKTGDKVCGNDCIKSSDACRKH